MLLDLLLRFFSSLKLTVVCLALATVLVFIGTLAQVTLGLYEVQTRFFQSFFVFWDLPGSGIRVPVFPGGYLIGFFLLVNLLVAYARRLGFKRGNFGLLLIHFGLVFLLLGQLWTDLAQRESVMRLEEGQTRNYSESTRRVELAVVDPSPADHDQVVAIPQDQLRTGAEIRHPSLPFTMRLQSFWENSAPVRGETNLPPIATQGVGRSTRFVERPKVTSMDERDVPTAVVEVVGSTGSLGTWVLSEWLMEPQSIEVDGRRFQVALRLARYYKPFSISLLEARHDKYKGTEIPRNFSSRVRVQNPATREDREVLIFMNNPLRYGGFTFYQYQMAADEAVRRAGQKPSSTLQVVRNPGWLVPYISCILVGTGLTWQFLSHLLGFARRRREAAAPNGKPGLEPARAGA